MADSPTLIESLKVFGMVFGPGGAVIAIVAYLNRKPPAVPPPASAAMESPWLIQNLLEVKLNSEGTKHSIDALTSAVMSMATQINTIAALLRREHHKD